ncbi:MAG: putative vitamin B12 receptor (TonB-dependent) [Bacteroidales bacterium]
MFCFCVLFSFGAAAQEADSVVRRELPPVEVVEKAPLSVTREGAPVQLLRRAELDKMGVQELAEAVKRFAGVNVKDYGGIGGLKTVSVRSLGARHTAVSYDGVTVTDAQSGQIDISRFSLDNVESISLAAGQSGDIFQTARMYASAGVLSVTTQTPHFNNRCFHIEGQLKGGSFGMLNPSLRYEQKMGDRLAASLHADRLTADGQYPYTFINGDIVTRTKRKNSDIKSLRTELNLFGDWQTAGRLHLKGYWFDSRRGLPGAVILYNDYHKERLQNRNGFVQGVYERRLNPYLIMKAVGKFDYSRTRYQDFHSKYIGGEQTDVYTQREYYGSAALLYTRGLRRQTGSFSFSLAEDVFQNTLDATTPLCAFPRRITSLTAAAAQYQSARLTVTAGLLGTYIAERVERGGEPAGDRKRLSPAFSLSWCCLNGKNLRIRASYKDNFRVPTFNDLYYDRAGSKNLRPEQAAQYNVGITWSGASDFLRLNYVSLTADAYYNRVRDKIVALPTLFIWRMMNMGAVDIRGLDINLSARFRLPAGMKAQFDGSYSLQNALDVTDKTAKTYRHRIPYTPQHSGAVSVTVEHRWLNIGWLLSAVSERYSLPQNTEANRMAGYAEQQLSLNRTFATGKRSAVRLQMEFINLGNVSYDVIRYYPMPGRSFRATVRFYY